MVSTYWGFTLGNCEFGDDKCWFIHSASQKLLDINCEFCGDKFTNKNELHKHKKHKQAILVPKCKDIEKRKYGDDFCWFIHEQSTEDDSDKTHLGKESQKDKK